MHGFGMAEAGYRKLRLCGERASHRWSAVLLGRHLLYQRVEQHRVSRSDQLDYARYHNAAKCYVYLMDILTTGFDNLSSPRRGLAFRASRWYSGLGSAELLAL